MHNKPHAKVAKKAKALARGIRETANVCTGRDVAEAIDEVELSPEEARAWLKDLVTSRRALAAPEDKWR